MPVPAPREQQVDIHEAAATRYIRAGEQALAEAQGFDAEATRLRAAGTLTEARAAELDASYARAFAEYERNAGFVEASLRMRRANRQMETVSADQDELDVRHPRGGSAIDPNQEDAPTVDPPIETRGVRRTVAGPVDEPTSGTRSPARTSLDIAMRNNRDKPGVRAILDRFIRARQGDSFSQVEMRSIEPYRDTEGHWGISHEISNQVIRQIRERVHIMSSARVITTNAASISFPTFYYRGAGLAAHRMGAVYAGKTFKDILGMTDLTPHARGNTVSVPEELVEDLGFPLLEFLGEEIVADCGEQKEAFFLTGTGKGEPLGILHSSVPLADYETAGAALAADDIKGFIYNLSEAKRAGAEWMIGRPAMQKISKFREDSGASAGTGNYMFRAGLEDKDGPRLVGLPIMESEWYPDGTASGAAAGTSIALLGNWFLGYWIVMRLAVTVKRLAESKDDAGNITFKYRERYTGAPVRLDMFANLVKKA